MMQEIIKYDHTVDGFSDSLFSLIGLLLLMWGTRSNFKCFVKINWSLLKKDNPPIYII